MADQQLIQLLSKNFGSRTFAYKRLVQGLNRLLSTFTSFAREYRESVVKADRCAQNVDDIGVANDTTDELIQRIQLVFQCINKAGLKMSMDKCSFGQAKISSSLRQLINNESDRLKRQLTTL